MQQQRQNLQKYAREYYLMGNECITKAHDPRAAQANYDKALELYPEYVDAWVRKGVTFFDENRVEEAEECLNRAVQLRPQDFQSSVQPRKTSSADRENGRSAFRFGQGYQPEATACRCS